MKEKFSNNDVEDLRKVLRCKSVCISFFSKFSRVVLKFLVFSPLGFLGRNKSDIEVVLEVTEDILENICRFNLINIRFT